MSARKTPDNTVLAERYIIVQMRGKPLNSGERKIVLTVFGNLLAEFSDTSFRELYEWTAALTGTSRATVERIKQAADKGDTPRTPGRKRPVATASQVHKV